jgi:hypothetical protein
MAENKCGWAGKFISFSKAPPCSLNFFTFSDKRVNGHVSINTKETKDMENYMAHASQSHNKFMLSKIKKGGDEGFYNHLSHTKEID